MGLKESTNERIFYSLRRRLPEAGKDLMKVIFSAEQLRHHPAKIMSSGALTDSPENPGRAKTLLQAAIAAGLKHEEPGNCGRAPLAAIHSKRYLTFLENIHTRWLRIPDASTDVLPNVHPDTRDVVYPKSAVGQVGFHVFDGAAPITADTWSSACWSASSAVHAAHEVLRGAASCYALARPPGHHATSDLAGGFLLSEQQRDCSTGAARATRARRHS